MSKFIEVRDDDSNEWILLNIDCIVSISENRYGAAIVNLCDRRRITLYEQYEDIKEKLDCD